MPNLARQINEHQHDAHADVPDSPIESSVISPGQRAKRHFGFFPYFATKPWYVVQEYIKHYTAPGDLVCDPFAGSGTTPVEALVLNRRAVASDINPLSLFITRMTAVAPVDIEALRAAFERVKLLAQKQIESLDSMSEAQLVRILRNLDYPRDLIPETVRRTGANTVNELHTPRQLAGLAMLRDAINQTRDTLLRDLLRMAFARTVRSCNKTFEVTLDRGRQRSVHSGDPTMFKRGSYSLASSNVFYEHQVWGMFERSFKNIAERKSETNQLIGDKYNPANFTAKQLPASRIHELTGENAVDYCFTDPPYSNEIYFVDLSVLWTAWLNLKVTPQTRRDELMEGGVENKTRQQFEQEFAASVKSIALALKQDRWFTLVFKSRDVGLWHTIVDACEQNGLRYINAVWQDLKVTSVSQFQNPNTNPPGDMYLNFRKMTQRRFERIYPRAEVVDLPTIPNYVEKEIERLIVSYLGADIQLIVSSVVQQSLDSRIFKDGSDNLTNVKQNIAQVLKSPRFAVWDTTGSTNQWVLADGERLETSLPAIDRLRYHIFEFLRTKEEATEGEIQKHLLTIAPMNPDAGFSSADFSNLLRSIATQVTHRRWRFDAKRVLTYKQLRLFFQPSKADELRATIEARQQRQDIPLSINYEGVILLIDRLRNANTDNNKFGKQSEQLQEILRAALNGLKENFESQIEQVLAVGEWVESGVDLRELSFEETVLNIVLRSDERSFALYSEIASKVFANLDRSEMLLQFNLLTRREWEHSTRASQNTDGEQPPGITLLNRA